MVSVIVICSGSFVHPQNLSTSPPPQPSMSVNYHNLAGVLKTHARGRPLHVIFCPGMGGSGENQDDFYTLWQSLHIHFASWKSFAAGGSSFIQYNHEDTSLHPGGRPLVLGDSIERLLALVRTYHHADHVLLVGFSAGAYLTLRSVQAMEMAPCDLQPSVSFFVMGHYLFADELMAEPVAVTPGVIIFGQNEMTASANVWPIGDWSVADLVNIDPEKLAIGSWGGYLGDPQQCALTERSFRNAHVLLALGSGHFIPDYDRALWYGRVYYLTGQKLPSSLGTSSRSSASSAYEYPEPLGGARNRSHSI